MVDSKPTIKGSTFNEEAVLFPIEKLNNFSQLTILAHQQAILSLSLTRDLGEVVIACRGWI